MELTHSFTVPASVADTWAAFSDIASAKTQQGSPATGTAKASVADASADEPASGTSTISGLATSSGSKVPSPATR